MVNRRDDEAAYLYRRGYTVGEIAKRQERTIREVEESIMRVAHARTKAGGG